MAKFTIRDVLLVTVIVALAVGWLVDRNRRDEIAPPATATYFYVVNSPEQAEQVRQSELISSQEASIAGFDLEPHEVVILDMSTPEGARLYDTVNGALFEMWDNAEYDQSLVQIIDLR